MFPANQCMDPYHSHYRNHSPYPYYPPPRWEAGHPQAMDFSYRPPSYGPWPCNAGMHHPHHPEVHCCCNHTYSPANYGFRPSFPQELPPPHLYYHGPFPQHLDAYPSYFAPPHPYSVDQTPYGHEKFKSHCCGCPNHSFHGGEKSNVKIEEERADVKPGSEQKDAGSGSIICHPNNQYPFVWLPPSNMEDKESRRHYQLPTQFLNGWVPVSNVKTEEERIDVKPGSEQKHADSAGIIGHPNNQYPFVWLPPGNMEDMENGRRYEVSPQFLNGWVPVSSKRTGDVKQQEKDNEKGKQFQWPIVWMPQGYDEPKQKAKELKKMDESSNASEEASSPKIKIIPLSWFENDRHDQKPAAKDHSGDHDRSVVKGQPSPTENRDGTAVERNDVTNPVVPKRENDEWKPARETYKTIPVVPEKETNQKKVRTIPVVALKGSDEKVSLSRENIEANKASNDEKEGENGKVSVKSSTAKHSKLSPVCLRVDPLPRKKSSNGSSRSLSLPTRKDSDKARKGVKEGQSRNLETNQSDAKKHTTTSEVVDKTPNEMKERMGYSNETEIPASVKHSVSQEEDSTSKYDQKVQANSASVDAQENVGAKSLQGVETKQNAAAQSFQGGEITNKDEIIISQNEVAKDSARTCRTNLSESDAAILIQSAYRGYDVRRSQPLEKLQKIREVHEQMQGVRKQMQCLETSPKRLTGKEQVAISENIMNLLLKLDTIQGFHQSVREARKSVARELICLQEKLDTLCKQPSEEFNHTNSEEHKPDKAEQVMKPDKPADPTSTDEASDKERHIEPGKEGEPSSEDFIELCDTVPFGVSMKVKQDAGSSEQENKKEEPCTTTIEVALEEGKSAGQVESQVASSMGMMSDTALPEHPTDNQENQIESNVVSIEDGTEEEKSAGEGQEVPLVDSMEPLHDATTSEDSTSLKQFTSASEQNLPDEELIVGISPVAMEDTKATTVTADSDGSREGQMQAAVDIASLELNHDVCPADYNQPKESCSPVANLEDLSVSLKDAEQHEHDATPTIDSDVHEQPEAPMDINMQEKVLDTKEPDETPGVLMNETPDGLAASPDEEKTDQVAMLELTSESDPAREQIVLEESDDTVKCDVSSKDELTHVDRQNEPTVDKLTGVSANIEDPLLEAMKKEPEIQDIHPDLAEEGNNIRSKTVFPEYEHSGLSSADEGVVTGNEKPEMKVSSERQMDAQEECVCFDSSCTGMQASQTHECDEMLKEDDLVPTTKVNSADEEPNNPQEDVGELTENRSSSEGALSASANPDGLKDSDDKNLAEENQKLKELLKKLLASGNDQLGVITDLSEKVKALEKKLARKKRPKVRVHRPSRHATAKVQ